MSVWVCKLKGIMRVFKTTNNNAKKNLHGAIYGQGLLINGIKNGGYHTRSQDIRHTISGHFYITFNGKMTVSVIKMIIVKNNQQYC